MPATARSRFLRGVSLEVKAGQVVSMIGPNGAGKSTMFKTLFGLLRVTQGQVMFEGRDITNAAPGTCCAQASPSFRRAATCFR